MEMLYFETNSNLYSVSPFRKQRLLWRWLAQFTFAVSYTVLLGMHLP